MNEYTEGNNMKRSIELLVHDWNPNGTNDVSLLIDGSISHYGLDEATFGIDINAYDPIELEPDAFAAVVPLKVVVKHLAISPTRSAAQSYRRLMNFINAGEK
jgi:hypothetical protein